MLRALVLGVVQGVTEFLPISSSAHLVLVPYALGWPRAGLAFDVALHLGTLAAVAWHFRGELARLARSVVAGGRDRRLLGLLAVGSVPVAVAGLLLESHVERVFAEPRWTAGLMLVMAGWLVAGEWAAGRPTRRGSSGATADPPPRSAGQDPATRLRWGNVAVVGVAQAAALLPGISRSGSTIATGLLLGMDRQTAARFSFLLSIPAILGAIASQVPDVAATPDLGAEVVVGTLAAFASGLWAIRWLLRVISTRGLGGFAVYLGALAVVVLVTGQG